MYYLHSLCKWSLVILAVSVIPINMSTLRTPNFSINTTTWTSVNPSSELQNESSTESSEQKHQHHMNLCQFSVNQSKADILHKKFIDYTKATRPGVFYLNFVYQRHSSENVTLTKRDESGVFMWSLVTNTWSFLLTYPVDLHVVTFGTIRGSSEDIYESITLKNPDSCFMYYSYAVDDMKNLIQEKIVRNYSYNDNIKICHRNFQNQETKVVWYQFTRIWDGYLYECYNASCIGKKCGAKTEHMSAITNVVYILSSVGFLFYPLIFAIVKRDKTTDPKWINKYQRTGDTPFGLHRLKMRYFFVSPIRDSNVVSKTYIPECRLILLLLIALVTAYIARPILTYDYFGQKLRLYPDLFVPRDKFRELYLFFLYCINVEPFSTKEIILFAFIAVVLSFFLYVFHVISIKTCCEEDDFVIVVDPTNPFWKEDNSWRISVSDFTVEGSKKAGGIAEMFYKRMALAFTAPFWQFIIAKSLALDDNICRCCPIKCINTILRIFCRIGLFVVMIFNLVFNLITCFVPVIWLLVGTFIKICFQGSKNMTRMNLKHNDSNDTKTTPPELSDRPNGCCRKNVCCYIGWYLFLLVAGFVFLEDLIIRSLSFMIKIFTYFLFVAIPSFPTSQLRVVLIVVSALTYLGKYIKGFLTAYEKLLSIIFEAEDSLLKENIDENEGEDDNKQDTPQDTPDKVEFIPVEEFDYICTNTFPVALQVVSLLVKICITGMFLYTAVIALQNNGNFATTRRTNFVEILSLIFIVLSPTVAEIALTVSLEDKIEMQKTEIISLVKKWNNLKNKSINKNLFTVNAKTATGRLHIAETRNKTFTQNDKIITCCSCCINHKSNRKTLGMRLCYYLLFVFCCCCKCDKDGRCLCWRFMKSSKTSGGKHITKRGSVYGSKIRALVFEYPCLKSKESKEYIEPLTWNEEESSEV